MSIDKLDKWRSKTCCFLLFGCAIWLWSESNLFTSFQPFHLAVYFLYFPSAQFYFISFNCSFQTPSHFDNLFFCEFLRDLFTLLVICAFLGLKSHRIRENWKENRRLGKGKRKVQKIINIEWKESYYVRWND